MTDGYQQFYKYWKDHFADHDYSNSKFPYSLSLGKDGTYLPFRLDSTSGGRILVTKSYDDMFHRLLRLRESDKGDKKGAVVTGQPGIGASL